MIGELTDKGMNDAGVWVARIDDTPFECLPATIPFLDRLEKGWKVEYHLTKENKISLIKRAPKAPVTATNETFTTAAKMKAAGFIVPEKKTPAPAPVVSDAEFYDLKAKADKVQSDKLREKTPVTIDIPATIQPVQQVAPAVHPVKYNDDQISLLKAKVAPNATTTEFELLMYLSQKYNLDPLLRQIWLVKFGDTPAQIYAGRDGFLEIAHRSGHFDGMETKVSYDDAGKPLSAVCTVWRNDMTHPFIADVLFKEYTTGKNLWTSKPSVMIGKVAESVALRKAFSVSGLYCPEEMN